MNVEQLMPEFKNTVLDELAPATSVCAIGIGSAGSIITNQIFNVQVQNITTISINTEQNNLSANYFFKLQNGTLGEYSSTEGRVKIGEQLIDDLVHQNNLLKITDSYDYLFLVAALGGGLGTGGLIEMLKNLKKGNKYIVTIVILPFEFENRNLKYLAEIKELAERLIIVKNDEFVNSPADVFNDVLARANEKVVNIVLKASEILNNLKEEQINGLLDYAGFDPQKALNRSYPLKTL